MDKEKVQVSVRVRPLIQREIEAGKKMSWNCGDNVIEPVQSSTNGVMGQPYKFDHVFKPEVGTSEVYKKVVARIVEESFQGYNGTVLCYGQTSSGKTHTLYGNDEEEGIISLASKQLFELMDSDRTRNYYIRLGLLEIYNEKVTDLLNDGSVVTIREKAGVVYPEGLKELEIVSAEDMLKAARVVKSKRKIGETRMNQESSRSHTILRLRILIENIPKDDEEDPDEKEAQATSAVLCFVDLAGSEKASQTGATGERFKEATYINKSLSVLAQVLLQLSTDGTRSSVGNSSKVVDSVRGHSLANQPVLFVNYRDSKLTRILQSSLSGNAHIALICNVTPATVEETHSTLRFARTAKNVNVGPTKNQGRPLGVMYRKKILELENLLIGKTAELETLRKKIFREFSEMTQSPRSSLFSRRNTICPSMLRRNSGSLKTSCIVIDDFRIPSSSFLSFEETQTTPERSVNPSNKNACAEGRPKMVDVSTTTDFVELAGESTISVKDSIAAAQKSLPDESLNQSLLQEWSSEKSFLQHEFESVLEEKDVNHERSLTELKTRLQQQICENQEIREDYENLRVHIQILEDELRRSLEEERFLKQKLRHRSESEDESRRQEIHDLIKIREELLHEKENLKQYIAERDIQYSNFLSEKGGLIAELDKAKAENRHLQTSVELLETELREMKSLEANLSDKYLKLRLNWLKSQHELLDKDNELHELRVKCQQLSPSLESALKENKQLEFKFNSNSSEIIRSKVEELEKLKHESSQMKVSQEALQQKVTSLETEKSSLKNSLNILLGRLALNSEKGISDSFTTHAEGISSEESRITDVDISAIRMFKQEGDISGTSFASKNDSLIIVYDSSKKSGMGSTTCDRKSVLAQSEKELPSIKSDCSQGKLGKGEEIVFRTTLMVADWGIGEIHTLAYHVSHSSLEGVLFPERQAWVVRRISPEVLWTILEKIKKTKTKEVAVLRLGPETEVDEEGYDTFFSCLSSERRFAVICDITSPVEQVYLIPLDKHSLINEILLPFAGPGLPDDRTHCLLAVIIRNRANLELPSTRQPKPKSPLLEYISAPSFGASRFAGRTHQKKKVTSTPRSSPGFHSAKKFQAAGFGTKYSFASPRRLSEKARHERPAGHSSGQARRETYDSNSSSNEFSGDELVKVKISRRYRRFKRGFCTICKQELSSSYSLEKHKQTYKHITAAKMAALKQENLLLTTKKSDVIRIQ